MERPLTLQLTPQEPQSLDYETASRLIKPLAGKFYAIEPGPVEKIGSIYLSDGAGTSLASDCLTVIAVGDSVDLRPGDSILVRPTHGDWIEGFEVPGYKAPQRVRVYGTACEFQGEPVAVDWDEAAPLLVHDVQHLKGTLMFWAWPSFMLTESRRAYGVTNNMALEATGKNILIRRDPTVTRESGLELPESAQYRTCLATVVSVGAMVREVKVGDRVHYSGLAILDFMFGEDKDLAVVTELGINAVIAPVEVAA